MVEIRDIEVGDIIKIIDDLRYRNGAVPDMYKYAGITATITEVRYDSVKIAEDNGEWYWYSHLIDAHYSSNDVDFSIASPAELSDFLTNS